MSQSPINVRRKPRQSRAKFTQQALLDSAVQLLAEKHHGEITVREMTEIAGVGLGTFYEYFSQKEDVFALIIHQQIKVLAQELLEHGAHLRTTQPDILITDYVKQLIHIQLKKIQNAQQIWATIFLLERQLSTSEVYQKHYALMCQLWQDLLQPFAIANLGRTAINLHRVIYGFVMQTLLVEPDFSEWTHLETDIGIACNAFLKS
ncbi:transcriptional regulator, TetR family [Acinetobacter marinus]|uniref:Transcriptional regulator, TetR family n=1 Tax=Acinetobacter marinus TaxID=281375 RepID=A0A1G6HI39_9GAMM|nr:TetR/AcrR family transcriptional regulator [Acinetobacter marinus]SDB93902.1 transcriptional regulator, TetR family [Acinetobacter marinus]